MVAPFWYNRAVVNVSRRIHVNAPPETVSRYLRDISNLAEYEQKVVSVREEYPDADSAKAEVIGRFIGFPWKGTFEMRWTPDGGFESRMTEGPLTDMCGGFHLRRVQGGTILTHYEQYGFPGLLRPLYPFLRRWLGRSMDVELGVIKEAVERTHRQETRTAIDSEVRV